METLRIHRSTIAVISEIVILFIYVLRCFGECSTYTLDQNDFSKCFNGDLKYFDDGSVGIETNGSDQTDVMECSLRLRSGAYDVKVIYESVSSSDNNADDCGGEFVLSTGNPSILKTLNISLQDGANEAQSRLWIRQRFWIKRGNGYNEVKMIVRYHGEGKLSVKSVQVEEKREYRILICFAVMGVLTICDLIYIFFVKKDVTPSMREKRKIIAGVVGITILSSITFLADFLYWGHDMAFHLSRIVSLANALKEYQIPHRIQFEMMNGYGYATPLYYGEVFLILPAILYNLYLPLQTCYQIFVVAVNFMTCIISFWCFTRMSNDWKKGLLGSLLYTFASYRMMDVMVRAAVGEYTALVFFPLLVYSLWRIYSKDVYDKTSMNDGLPMIFAATGIIHSHILSCEMVLLFVILFMLVCFKKTFRKNVLAVLVRSAIISFLLNMWFIVPFIQSMGMHVNVSSKEKINYIEKSTAYLAQLFGIFHTANGGNKFRATQGEMPLSIGLPLMIGICLFIYVYIRKDEWNLQHHDKMKAAKICFVLGLTAVVLASSLFRWDNLIYFSANIARIAGMVQFPWRYLGIATVLLITMIICILQILEEHISAGAYNQIVLVMVAAMVITEGYSVMEYVNLQQEKRVYSEADVGSNIAGAEYLLWHTDVDAYKDRKIIHSADMECTELYYYTNGKYHLSCNNKADVQNFIDVPIHAYDNYHVYTNDGKELGVETGEDNRIRVLIPGNYQGMIFIKYVVPVSWRLCEIISLVTMGIIVLGWVCRGKIKRLQGVSFVSR